MSADLPPRLCRFFCSKLTQTSLSLQKATLFIEWLQLCTPTTTVASKDVRLFDFCHHMSLEHLTFSLFSDFAGCRGFSTTLSTVNLANAFHMKHLSDVGTEVNRVRPRAHVVSIPFLSAPVSWGTSPAHMTEHVGRWFVQGEMSSTYM